jgi:hypothetical protein
MPQIYIDYIGVFQGFPVHARSIGVDTIFWLSDNRRSYPVCMIPLRVYNQTRKKYRKVLFVKAFNMTADALFDKTAKRRAL